MVSKVKKAIVFLAAIGVIVLIATGFVSSRKGEMRNMSTAEIVRDMGLGINLGNTFESCGMSGNSVQSYETGWGSPVITREIINGYAESGFGVLRVPVAWSNMMGNNYTINSDYLERVKEVVDWALESDMYVILNIHWDGGWFERFGKDEDKDECMYKYTRIWKQLSAAFKNYGDKLIFESLNEEGCWDEIWNRYSGEGDKDKAYGLLNEINQTFTDTVRDSGGNNKKRHLLIAGYATDIAATCDEAFKMPNDPEKRCAVSVHYYNPSTFAILERDADWGKARTEWGTDEDIKELEQYMDMLKTTFVDNGTPVIIGEYGTSTKNKTSEMIRKYLVSVCESAYTRDICPVLWDITGVFYDRGKAEFIDPKLLDELMDVKNKTSDK
ncbi:MAG: glycoside hydrolase family 5 protein [Eubacterium sp.]|nr:glycoside hydrolase family 5 protein [Eubacterium sp.]